MSTVPLSRRHQITKKGNKENAEPGHGMKSTLKREFTKSKAAVPFQQKGNEKEDKLVKTSSLKTSTRQVDPKSATAEVLKKAKSAQKDVRGAAVSVIKQRQVLTEQTVRHKAMVAEVPKAVAPVPQTKPAPGMYKGKIVQSKIGSIWKSSTTLGGADSKPTAPKMENPRVGNWAKSRSKSVADIPRRGPQNPAPLRSKSVLDGRAQVSKPPSAATRPPAAFRSARPPTRTVPATQTSTGTRKPIVAPSKPSGTQKPKMPVTDKKVSKPPVTSSLSQYRTTETLEERRAKLAEWMASKGKFFKRPAMTTTTAAALKTKVPSKPKSSAKPPSHPPIEVQQTVPQHEPEPTPKLHEEEPEDNAADCADTQRGASLKNGRTPVIMNTTLDLLETSDDQPSEPDSRVDDIVVNLCDALEAMETPSTCDDELPLVRDQCNGVEKEEDKQKEEDEQEEEDEQREEDEQKEEDERNEGYEVMEGCQEEMKNEKPQDVYESVAEQLKDEDAESVEEVGSDVEESDDEEEEEMDDDDEVMESTPKTEEASVIKYSVKTTPYLQSVKKTIEGEVGASASRRKSNIKDLKFLTPVRRSSRIQRQSSRLPSMLVDHDPCVSSLAELVMLDDDPNAYIYRKNTALLEDLPDQSSQ